MTSRILVTAPSGRILSHSPDLAAWLGMTVTDAQHLLGHLPQGIRHQALPLTDGSTAHSLTRAPADLTASLRQSDTVLRETLDAIDGPVVVYNSDLVYVFGNAAYHAFYPHLPPEAELIGKSYDHVLGLSLAAGATVDPHGRADPAAFIAERRAFMLRRDDIVQEVHNPRLDRWSTVRSTWTPSGNRVSLRVNITPIKRLQQELLHTQRIKTIGHISGGVAHHFNNLLTVIISSIEMLMDVSELPDTGEKFAQYALDSAQAGAQLVRQLLSFARHDFEQTELIDPAQALADMAGHLRGAAEANITLELQTDKLAGLIRVNRTEFTTALLGLVRNAGEAIGDRLKADPGLQGRIDIAVTPSAAPQTTRGVVITVTDNGCGMTPDIAAAAFDPFFTTKGQAVAAGLGLSQVQSFAIGAGGEVRIHSKPGTGTSVELRLPTAASTPEPA